MVLSTNQAGADASALAGPYSASRRGTVEIVRSRAVRDLDLPDRSQQQRRDRFVLVEDGGAETAPETQRKVTPDER